MRLVRPRSPVAASLSLLAVACGGGSSTGPQPEPASVSISHSTVSFSALNATFDLVATVRDAGGAVISGVTVTWTTNASAVATVSSQGRVTAVGNGTAQITASVGTLQASATVTVQQVAATLSLSPDTVRLGAATDTATVVATVRDSGGSPMSGVTMTWATANPAVATVNSAGRVTAQGSGATTVTAEVAPGGSALTKSVRVEVGGRLPPAYLVGGYVGVAYSDEVGPATGGSGTFTYAVTAGALPGGLALNASNARITGTPTTAGVFFFQVTATSGLLTVSERYAITVSTKPPGAFNLWVTYNGGPLPPANASSALTQALARFEAVITGDAGAAVTYPPTGLTSTTCSLVDASLLNGAFVEDVAILMAVGPIDGAGRTLARGGPCGYGRAQRPAVITGQMLLDEVDAATATTTYLRDIVWHEVAHALGMGTLWQDSTRFAGTDSVVYVGKNAKDEWTALGGPGNVPLEPQLGAHWHEAWFNTELMTPVAEGPATPMPISRVTIGALLDLGWTASLSAADAYSLPPCAGSCTAPPRALAGAEARGTVPDYVIERLLPLPPQAKHGP